MTKTPIEEVETSSYDPIPTLTSEETQDEGAWICDLYERASMLEEITRTQRMEQDDAYVPQPTSTIAIDEHVWIQVLSTIDVSALSKGTQFCDELGYDVQPVLMISISHDKKENIEPMCWIKDEVSIRDVSSAEEKGYLVEDEFSDLESELDMDVDEENLNKIRELLGHRNTEQRAILDMKSTLERQKARRKRREKQARSKGIPRTPPQIKGKNEYLHMVGAVDCIKDYNEWKTSFGLIQSLQPRETKQGIRNKQGNLVVLQKL